MPSLTISLSLKSSLRSSTRGDSYGLLDFNPNLVFDFKNSYYRKGGAATTFSSAITHTRASSATMVNSSGTLVTVGNNVPRTGHHIYNGSTWVNEGILHESEARTNLVTYSEDLSNGAWTKVTGATIGTPVTRKGISLGLIESNGVSNFGNVTQSMGSVANGAYATFSCFIEAGTSTETAIRIAEGTGGTNRFTVPITWTAGVPTLQADSTFGLTFVSASVQDYGDGLYRVHIATLNNTGGALTLDAKYYVQWDDTAAAVNTYAGGFQAETASTPSSYIPTAGATATRAADLLTVPAANLPYNSTNMSIQIDGKITYADSGSTNTALPWRWRADNSNIIYNRVSTSGSRTGQPQFLQGSTSSGADSVVGGNNVYSAGTDVPFNLAGRYGSTFLNGAHEGTLLTADTTPTSLPALSSTNLELGQLFMGTIGQFRMWDEDITDAGITEAST